MNRRSLIIGAINTSLVLSIMPVSAMQENKSAKKNKGKIIHSVYFWLKEGITAEEEKDFLQYFEVLKKVPGARSVSYGKPAGTTVRDVTDNTFDYNLIITFDSLSEIATYETHPKHMAGAEKYSKYWTRVQVRDTEIL